MQPNRQTIHTNFAADFSSFIVEVVQKTTDLFILIPILRKLGAE